MAVHFSRRTAWNLEEGALAGEIRRARSEGRSLIDLTVANPTVCGFEYATDLLTPLSSAGASIYEPDPRGMRSAREAVATYYADAGRPVDPDHIVLTTSTSEAYSFVFRLLCDGGDEVLIAQPSYPLFDFLADLDDVQLKTFPMHYDHGWWIDFDALERAISPQTRAIVLVHPNNPTGNYVRGDERQRVLELCEKRGLALIVDEVFLDYGLEGPGESFAASDAPVLTFVLSGISKIAGLPQMKAAWIVCGGPAQLRDEAVRRLEIIADTFLSMNAPVQYALPGWLAAREGIQQQILTRVRTNLHEARRWPDEMHVLRVDAGWSAILRLPETLSSEDCAMALLVEAGVIAHPGSFYGMPEKGRAVISLLTPPEKFRTGMQRIAQRTRHHCSQVNSSGSGEPLDRIKSAK